MKRALLILSLATAGFTASAQAIIPFIGGNLSAYAVKGDGYTATALPGWNLGGIGEIDLSSRFSLQPGLQYCFIGGQLTNSELPVWLVGALCIKAAQTKNRPAKGR